MAFDLAAIREEIDAEVGSLPWVSATIIGVSYLSTALVAVLLVVGLDLVVTSKEAAGLPSFGSGRGFVQSIVWTFYGAHAVPIKGGLVDFNLLDAVVGGIPTTAYYLIPAAATFMSGRSIARSNGHTDMSNEALGALGALTVVGYGGVMFLGIFLSEWKGVAPATSEGVLFATLGFPLVFGFLGGYLADR